MKSPQLRSGPIDWQKIRERLARADAALAESHVFSPHQARAILEERARLLARVPPQALHAAEVVEVLIFALGRERYALETVHIREVLRLQECTPLPGTPDFLVGITNVRGQILALFDLRRFFGLEIQDSTANSRILVLGGERPELGVLADEVMEVTRLRTGEILDPPGSVAGLARDYMRGVTEKALIVIDGAKLLHDPRLVLDHGEDGRSAPGEVRS